MLKKTLICLMLMFVPMTVGCAGCQNQMKHMKSDIIGLDRTITLYGANGTEIRSWKTRAKVEDRGGACYFLDDDNDAIIISGTFVIEEN